MKNTLAILVITMLAAPGHAASSAADRAWIGRCMTQLKDEHDDKNSVRIYCECMHEFFEDNENVTQNEMEHMFPPAHRQCHAKAGWK